ncbi:hypothetical protein QAD02_002358 [Eretmocerus hayati]|uniref:Uncharacterized protein n=1 Tax=Eretmocerus hayati TaxID=131215 RepID=A0ACC2NIZ8_9HYME|nr:hypothetical protein QAD02_002358 [Eretmocerus hayati]
MKSYLEHEDLWKCVEGDVTAVTNERNIAKVKAKWILSVDKSNYSHIRDASTPKQVWYNLKAAFEDSGLTRKVGLLRMLVTTRLENCASTEEYVNKICTTAQKLNSLNFTVGDE